MTPRNTSCSFCLKSYTEVGPLVEGPGEVYICRECVELCQSLIGQERRRHNRSLSPVDPSVVRERLDKMVSGQEEAKQALLRAVSLRHEGRGHVLLIGPTCSARHLLARALAHALQVPFAAGDSSAVVKARHGREDVVPLLFTLLDAGDFDVEAAQQGVVYLEGTDRPDTQEALLQLWQGPLVDLPGRLRFDFRGVLFICGGAFPGLDECIQRSGRHPEQPVTAEALVAAGGRPQWVSHLAATARTLPLDDQALTRLVSWVDFSRADGRSAQPDIGANRGNIPDSPGS